MLFKVIMGLVSLLIGIAGVRGETWDKEKKRPTLEGIFVIILSLILFTTGYLDHVNSSNEQDRLKQRSAFLQNQVLVNHSLVRDRFSKGGFNSFTLDIESSNQNVLSYEIVIRLGYSMEIWFSADSISLHPRSTRRRCAIYGSPDLLPFSQRQYEIVYSLDSTSLAQEYLAEDESRSYSLYFMTIDEDDFYQNENEILRYRPDISKVYKVSMYCHIEDLDLSEAIQGFGLDFNSTDDYLSFRSMEVILPEEVVFSLPKLEISFNGFSPVTIEPDDFIKETSPGCPSFYVAKFNLHLEQ